MGQHICIRVLADGEQISKCRKQIAQLDESIKNISGVLNLTGNEVRFKILFLLNKEKELCVCDLSDILGMNVSAISQHLRKLKDGNIVDVRKDGQTYYYFIRKDSYKMLNLLFGMIESPNEIYKTNAS